ncbi:hypothetical protein I2501_25700 [Streptacidiphilus sp. NEAU-YB345]|uniref:Uncharacterized protein n=1 Tax=Streptacidiphilus fuscans TaxID=2789292 RepID=A0A931FH16_9ACTN|nr:hypothetical protein [Streptacidiphilus fuscans]
MDLRVTKHVLWVGHAAYPIRNIARVFTFELRPRYWMAALRFFRRVGITLAALITLTIIDSLATSADPNSTGDGTGQSSLSGWMVFLWIMGVVAIIAWAVQLVQVLTEKPHPALAIETSGPSTAMVTLPERRELDQLVDALVGAIENPGREVIYQVNRLQISSPTNYYYGDVVNMYGGGGNTGMMK